MKSEVGRVKRGVTWGRVGRGVSLCLLGAVTIVSGCERDGSLAWCLPAAEGVEVVATMGGGAWGEDDEPARLEELWRAGGLNEGEELVYPVSLAASPEGRLAIADFQLSEVVVVEPDGTWGGPWGRRGEGPGELATPATAAWDRAGRLAVFDIAAPKVLFLRDGGPAAPDVPIERSFTAPIIASGELTWAGVQPDGGVLIQPSPQPAPAPAEAGLRAGLLLRLAAGATVPDTLVRVTLRGLAEGPWWGLPGAPQLLSALGPDGALAVAPAEPIYRILLHDSAGTPVRQICRDVPPLPISPRERGEGAEGFGDDAVRAVRDATPVDAPQPIGRLFWGARGRLWVQRDRAARLDAFDALFGAPGGLYDLFDQGGGYLGEVRAPPRARLQSAVGDTVFAFEFGDLDEAWVVAYRIVRE